MRIRLIPLATAVLCLPLFALAPAAEARAGMGSSLGSRGSRTWSAPPRTSVTPSWTRPMDRSMTPRTPSYGTAEPSMGSGFNRPAFGGGMRPPFAARHPFLTSLAGGFLGAGLFGMLSGHGFFGGFSGGGSFFGFIFQALLVALLINFIIKLWRRSSSTNNGPTTGFTPANGGASPFPNQPQATPAQDVTLTPEDYQSFQQLLLNVQAAWSAQDMASLQRMATPEMVSYFNNQLSELTSRGARNIVSQVRFIRGDLAEAWREGNITYASVALQYSAVDVTTDSMGTVLDGSKTEPQTITELWTFLRADGRGNWILSAIQQAG
ncbi:MULTISPECIES: Tim44 domain-containing protein [Bombella]|uniref:Tim44-like domain-containing protein n=1 Tax=Bombella pollinis TaxID=2967337 RepID=A0ABT3WLH3_9PROT|nr:MULTISPECIES: Tim44-like domain-containing protein [Bombella]MCT6855200.1 Tim44-like domain-containing protein [Bombella apis]MCX5619763.1 Tim44-like domain-containing protein [Bombella pollinis]MUG04472.1 Tim44 domain-containing protein [Bombella sp. ESL0378]